MNVSFLQELLASVAEQGRQFLPRALQWSGEPEDIHVLAKALISGRGEASGVAMARELLDRYGQLGHEDRRAFFRYLADAMKPETDEVSAAAAAYMADPTDGKLARLQKAVESPRQEFFRRLNLAPGATAEIVAMRRDLLRLMPADASLTAVDEDLKHLLSSWFNRGFLVLRRIDWQTPAAILEKIIAYEAVHEIQGWDDLRRRLDPVDRRCFAFFHPSLIDEPLIFVEVALMGETPDAINDVLHESRKAGAATAQPTTAVFYSISNCQEGLRGISFGNFLIKQVVEELAKERPSLQTFVTLSPVPMFARWLDRTMTSDGNGIVTDGDRAVLGALKDLGWAETPSAREILKPALQALVAHYLVQARAADGLAVDAVARFHLGNGARLERINWLGDVSEKGLREAHGFMVNYLYDLRHIERNHEAYENDGSVAASKAVRALVRAPEKRKPEARVLALPGRKPA